MKNLVIGTADGYSFYVLEPFIRSFMKFAQNTEMVVFVKNMSSFTIEKIKAVGKGKIKLQPFPKNLHSALAVNSRWEIFSGYLEKNFQNYDQVLATDTRDVIFQGDVFATFADQTEYIGYSTSDETLNGKIDPVNVANIQWIEACFGKEAASLIADEKIACAGTIIGSANEMRLLCQKISEILMSKDFVGADQATYNHIIYNKVLPIKNFIPIHCKTGVISVPSEWFKEETTSTDGKFILRADGGVAALFHQYDRVPSLASFVDKIYREKDFKFNRVYTDAKSAYEQFIQLIFADKFAEAVKVFSTYQIGKTDLSNLYCKGCYFRGYFDVVLYFWKNIIKRPPIIETEILEIAFQKILMDAISHDAVHWPMYLEEILNLTKFSISNGHLVSQQFKNFIINVSFQRALQLYEQNDFTSSYTYLKLLSGFNVPLNKSYFMLIANVCFKLGKDAEGNQAIDRAKTFDS